MSFGIKADPPKCWCWRCHYDVHPMMPLTRFIVCIGCGNKRCPRATHHDNACTGSNDTGQPGSRFESWPEAP